MTYQTTDDALSELAAENQRLRARIEELEKALEPFAKAADELIPGTPDEAGVMWDGIIAMANAGHLRTAARALKGEATPDQTGDSIPHSEPR
jgi:cell division septum initiation protein DivIVA